MAQQQSLWPCPDPSETQDLHFKLVCKLKVFDPQEKPFHSYTNLVATAQRYGLVFVGTGNGFLVIKTNGLNPATSTNEYRRKEIIIGSRPSHIVVDYNQDLLAVGCSTNQGCIALIYKISLLSQQKASALKSIPLCSKPNTDIRDLIWQPNSPNTFTCCFTDGSVLSLTLNPNGCQEQTLPPATQATCLCWSPKGKQIVIGCENGTLSQYKPDLKLVKTLPAPNIFPNGAEAVNVLWISSFQFAAAYKERNNVNSFPVIVIVNAVKNEPIKFINYDDITYSSSIFRVHQIYMLLQQAWNLLIVSSSNGMEVAVLHTKEDNATWEQWLLGDASRAELPLNPSHQETFPIGLALDYSATENIPWGENFIPPMPRLFLLSHEGILCVFNIVNLMQNIPQVCGPAREAFDESFFTNQPAQLEAPKPAAAAVPPPQGSTSFFGPAKPSSTFSFAPLTSTATSTPAPTPAQPAFGTSNLTFNFATGQSGQTAPNQSMFGPPPTQQPAFGTLGAQSAFGTQPTFAPTISKPLIGGSPQQILTSTVAPTPAAPEQPQIQPQAPLQQPQQQTPKNTFSLPSGTALTITKTETPKQPNLFGFASQTPKPAEATLTVKPQEQVQKPPEAKISAARPQEQEVKVDRKAVAPSPTPSPAPSTPEPPAVDDSIYINAIIDEIDHFSSEIELLSNRVSNFKAQIGTDDEKLVLRKKLDGLNEFWKELKETTISQNTEIHSVKADMMESFAWLEDAKSRNLQRKNPTYVQLKRSEELDPISSRHMTDIAHLKYYIENQLKQLNDYLDKEWMEHQDNCRQDVKNKMIIPSMEEVYKTMHLQLKILNRHRILIEDLKRKLSEKSSKSSSNISIIKNQDNLYSENLGTNRLVDLKNEKILLKFEEVIKNSDISINKF